MMAKISSLRIFALAFLAAGCAARAPMVASQPQCAVTRFPTNILVDAWAVDTYAGRCLNGSDGLTVRRDEHRLLVEAWALGTRERTAESVESWPWHDGRGASYAFALPTVGPGAWLKIILPDGSTSDWHR